VSYRILVTGSRTWDNVTVVRVALDLAGRTSGKAPRDVTVVHGGASGADDIADLLARGFGCQVEKHPASEHADPLARNRYMVSLGADVCLAFARRWASGTGACAREARKAGIRVIDMGVDTRIEARS
jgi:hypothetical protein